MFGLGIAELVVIFSIILIVFGVGKLPQIGEGLGAAIRGFKREVGAAGDLAGEAVEATRKRR